MSDSPPPPPPRAHLTLPGGHRVEVGVLRRVQRADGWRYEVVLDVPAATVVPTPGVDYSTVPTVREAPALVLQPLRHDAPDRRALELHVAGCWGATGRPTPATEDQARFFLDQGWAVRCDACNPLPPAP